MKLRESERWDSAIGTLTMLTTIILLLFCGTKAFAAGAACLIYDPRLYPYPASIEDAISENQGGAFSPYTLATFESSTESDIEHIVPRHIAHQSGLCRASSAERRAFATDLLNLTLATPLINRHKKSDRPPDEWMPEHSQCWYAATWIAVSIKYRLVYPPRARKAIVDRLATCTTIEMERP